MARITGKNAKVQGVLARTTVSVAAAMTDGGAHTVYTFVVSAVTEKFWNPNLPPAITLQTHGSGPFNPVSPSAYVVDYVNGTVTFLVANNSDDVVKLNGIEYMTLQDVGNMTDWALDMAIGITDVTAFQDQWAQKLSEIRSWKASADGYYFNSFWFDAFNGTGPTNPEFYVSFYPDAGAAERFVGCVTIDFALDVKKDAAVKNKLTMQGTGAIAHLTS